LAGWPQLLQVTSNNSRSWRGGRLLNEPPPSPPSRSLRRWARQERQRFGSVKPRDE
jgi:hypothetical protein